MSRDDFQSWYSCPYTRWLWRRWRLAWHDVTPRDGGAFDFCLFEEKL